MELTGQNRARRTSGLRRLEFEMPSLKCTDPQIKRLPLLPQKVRVAAPRSVRPTQYVRLTKIITVVFLPIPLRVFIIGF